MLVETAALSVGAGVVADDGELVLDAEADADEELELEPL